MGKHKFVFCSLSQTLDLFLLTAANLGNKWTELVREKLAQQKIKTDRLAKLLD